MYLILDPQYNISDMQSNYKDIKKNNSKQKYSSDMAEKLTMDELKKLIQNSGLL